MTSSLAVNVLSARTLGPSGRGHLALLLQVAYLPGLFALAGVDRVYPALVLPCRPSLRRAMGDLTRLVYRLTLCAAVVIYVVGFVIEGRGLTGYTIPVAIAAVAVGTICTGVLRAASTAASTGRIYVTGIVISQLALIMLSATLAARHVEATGWWMAAYAVALAVLPAVAWWRTRRHSGYRRRTRTSNLPGLRRAGWRVLPGAAASMLMLRSDRLLLPLLSGYAAAGWYIAIATLTEAATWPAQIWIDAHVPQWRTGRGRPVPILTAAAGYGAVTAVAITYVGHLLIVPIFGESFRPSLPLLAPLSAAAGIYCVSRAAIGISLAGGRLQAATWTDLPALLVAVGAYVLLIPHLGAMGAAWGSLVGYATAAVVSIVLVGRRTAPSTQPVEN